MACITLDKRTGGRRIQFFTSERRADGKRRRWSIPLGQETDEVAREIKAKVEHLIACKLAGHAWPPAVAQWVGRCEPELLDKLAAAELVPTRETPGIKLKAFLDGYIASREDWAPTTREHGERVSNHLVAHCGADRVLATITPFEATEFRRSLRRTMAESTTRKICSRAKHFFAVAQEKRLIVESPFAHIKKLAIKSAKKFFVTREMADKVLEACVDNQWRLIFVLCRYGGLRCPSEILPLRWGDVHWAQNRMTVHSPKTKRYEGKESRIIPIFPEVLPELQAVWDEAADGAEFVITRYRKSNSNLRTQLERTIKSAGLKPWPVLFNSLRATRAIELHDQFPGHVVNAWMGHTEKIAEKHYLQVTDDHFAAAIDSGRRAPRAHQASQKCTDGVHTPVSTGLSRSQSGTTTHENIEKSRDSRKLARLKTPPVGLEPTPYSSKNSGGSYAVVHTVCTDPAAALEGLTTEELRAEIARRAR